MNKADTNELIEYWHRETRYVNDKVDEAFKDAQDHAYALGLKRGKEEVTDLAKRTLAAKDKDFTQLSIAYSSAIEAGKSKCVQFTAEECQFVCEALEQCERLKDAVRWMLETVDTKHTAVSYESDKTITRGFNGAESLRNARVAARKAVEELIAVRETPSEQTPDDKFCNAVCNDDGTLRNFTLRIDGKSFRCECGCNVFHKPDRNNVNLYKCNGCGQEFNGE